MKTMDSLQLATAIDAGVDAFVTNDVRLRQIEEIRIIILKDLK